MDAVWLRLFLCCMIAGVSAWPLEPTSVETEGVRGWSQMPGLGEADNPGPLASFDDNDFGGWNEGLDEDVPLPGEENWAPDADADAWEDEQCQNEEVRPSADHEAVDSWLQQHAASEFVAVPNKKVTKKPKFQGEKPGWLFKLGA